MHFLTKTLGFLAFFAFIDGAQAASPRVGMVASTHGRMPSMSAYLKSISSGNTSQSGGTSSSNTTSNLLSDAECIDSYTECLQSDEVCGSGFEECTSTELFQAQMPKCVTKLYQCNTSGLRTLFGNDSTYPLNDITVLGTVVSGTAGQEGAVYAYPLPTSIMGQRVAAANIENRYDVQNCVKKYTNCIKKDSVCGEDFELCTDNDEFKKQAVLCASTLNRCPKDGIAELFGDSAVVTNGSLKSPGSIAGNSRIGSMISDGAALAAMNMVSTCYKVVDQCILNACSANPYRCVDGTPQIYAKILDTIAESASSSELATVQNMGQLATEVSTNITTSSNVRRFLANACRETVETNKYCYMTFHDGKKAPSKKSILDSLDEDGETWDQAYSTRMGPALISKIQDMADKQDKKMKDACVNTISQCAMRACGGGNGAVCYQNVFSSGKDMSGSIATADSTTYKEVKAGCQAVVNTDPNCVYAYVNKTATGPNNYAYIGLDEGGDAFSILFNNDKDPINAVAALNSRLSTSYNDAVLAQKQKQCENVAKNCVKSVCGNDYENCYRSRTDVVSSLTQTGNDNFDKSMNKVGGVLDYTIVLGLCTDTVKNAKVCEDHLAIQIAKVASRTETNNVWGTADSVREGWYDAGNLGNKTSAFYDGEGDYCYVSGGDNPNPTDCSICGTYNEDGDLYDQPCDTKYLKANRNRQTALNGIFQMVLFDIEKEAQAKYNAKLTKEQHMCKTANEGGLVGLGTETYQWVKLSKTSKGNVAANTYPTKGLASNEFVASNDLYDSFCRVRVTLQSDDPMLRAYLSGEETAHADIDTSRMRKKKLVDETGFKVAGNAGDSVAYFAVGDAFTCGGWLSQSTLDKMANAYSYDETADLALKQKRNRGWLTAAGVVTTGVGGIFGGKALVDKTNWFGKSDKKKGAISQCLTTAGQYKNSMPTLSCTSTSSVKTQASDFYKRVIEDVDSLKGKKKKIDDTGVTSAIDSLDTAMSRAKEDVQKYFDCCYEGGDCKDSNTTANLWAHQAHENLQKAFGAVENKCNALSETGNKKGWVKPTVIASTAVASSVIGGFAVNKITRDIQNNQLSDEQKKAYEEFMTNVGDKLNCVIGGQVVGSYGDIISTSLE